MWQHAKLHGEVIESKWLAELLAGGVFLEMPGVRLSAEDSRDGLLLGLVPFFHPAYWLQPQEGPRMPGVLSIGRRVLVLPP